MPAKLIDGISIADRRFAALVAQGCSQADAWRRTRQSRGIDAHTVGTMAHKVASKPEVKDLIQRLLRQAKIDELDSIGRYHSDLMQQIQTALDKDNLTAAAAFMRLRGQTIGVLQEKTVITDERSSPDSALIERLAKGDQHKAQMLRAILGDGDSYKT